jgi:hypothetical protein
MFGCLGAAQTCGLLLGAFEASNKIDSNKIGQEVGEKEGAAQ